MNRKKFLREAASAAAALVLANMEIYAKTPDRTPGSATAAWPVTTAAAGYELLILATDWGMKGDFAAFCAKVKAAGYNGIEMWWPTDRQKQEQSADVLQKEGLQVGFLCGAHQADPQAHLAAFREQIDAATSHPRLKPVYINCHSGRDFFPEAVNSAIIDHTIRRTKATGIPVYHETHRSRMLFAAHVARQFMEKHPDLRLTLDISHWCNVHESLLGDQPEAVQLALQRADHIHARIGHPEGPQVNDPRAPEWKEIVEQHLKWWDAIVARKKQAGERVTILTEFGPPDYMPTEPYSRKPLADQWAINLYMMNLLRKRYS